MSEVEELTANALVWLAAQARDTGDGGIGWPVQPSDPDVEDSLYMGTSGVVITLLDAFAQSGDQQWADLAIRGARHLAAATDTVEESGLYLGMTGVGFALHSVGRVLDDQASRDAARRAADVVRERFDGERWNECTELLYGHAGIALGALAIDEPELAVLACDALARLAEPADGGVEWIVKLDLDKRFHNMAHGTVGIAYALAAVGAATDRADLSELALTATARVLALGEYDDDGFRVHHSDPQLEGAERYSFGWCHGPTGDAQLFRLLAGLKVTGDWDDLVARCWHTVTHSGLPARVAPRFWDNNGHCCGTTGVLALALDLQAGGRTNLDFATVLVEDLMARAVVDSDGARWSNLETLSDPPDLEPQTGWAHGNTGMIRELLRYDAAAKGQSHRYAVPWPDQPE